MQVGARIANLILHAVGLLVLGIERADQHVVGDVVQVATVLEPGAGHTDVVCRTLALDFDQDVRTLQTARV